MKTLRLDESACASDKKEGLCENCLRNVDLTYAQSYQVWSDFTINRVKNFKTGVHFKCDGFLDKN